MKQAEAHLKSVTPYSASKFHNTPKLPKELNDDYEQRTWRERCNYNADGYVFIPQMAFKRSLAEASRFMAEKIPGQRNATWTKHFNSGVLVMESLVLPVLKNEVEGETFLVDSMGKKGSKGGSSVQKTFPVIRQWEGTVLYEILDDKITEDIFRRTLIEAGKFIGVGRFRPENGGFYGRYSLVDLVWVE